MWEKSRGHKINIRNLLLIPSQVCRVSGAFLPETFTHTYGYRPLFELKMLCISAELASFVQIPAQYFTHSRVI